jgi:pimeloyl-ACP methyl ester carboxylesterase
MRRREFIAGISAAAGAAVCQFNPVYAQGVSPVAHRTVKLNGIRMHIAEQGTGPLVLLCHGWPECWYSWRHQPAAIAAGGFHAVAPDMRGFGETDAPDDVHAYTIAHNVGDMVSLVAALGERSAVIVGHDWGTAVAWTAAQLRSDIFPAVAAMSVPYIPRGPVPPLQALRNAGITTFYWQYFQAPGIAEAEFEQDVDRTMRALLYGKGLSTARVSPGQGILREITIPEQLPSWLIEDDVRYYVETYRRTGFRGRLNWYRNIDRNWEISAAWDGLSIRQPALFVAGTEDGVIRGIIGKAALERLPSTVPGLKRVLLVDGAGHWVQQQRPQEVSAALLDFLHQL